MPYQALGMVGIGEHGGCGHRKDLRDLVVNVEDGRSRKPAALRESDMGCYLQGR
jgi:hypothetical protein